MNNNFKFNDNKIHPTAIIHPKVRLGKNNIIEPFSVINQHVEIGDDNFFGPHCIIGDFAEDIKFHWKHAKGVIIGNKNRFTKQVTIDCGTDRDTVIKNNITILKNRHIGHDSIIDDNCSVRMNSIVGRHVSMC